MPERILIKMFWMRLAFLLVSGSYGPRQHQTRWVSLHTTSFSEMVQTALSQNHHSRNR
jgi:hypothetical protein